MEAAESLFRCLEQLRVPGSPGKSREVRHLFQGILRLTMPGLVCDQTTTAHFARVHWPVLKEPLGFLIDHSPHATTISRTLAGVPCGQLQGAHTGPSRPPGG